MRGKDNIFVAFLHKNRITPAYAGKSTRKLSRLLIFSGSPPPMRGKARFTALTVTCLRITPAYAGKSSFLLTICQSIKDHPRLCGEKLHPAGSSISGRGSPPPMRGKGFLIPTGMKLRRITPAYAGKRRISSTDTLPVQDHPRLCGEKHDCTALPACLYGSPPPMRGKAKYVRSRNVPSRDHPRLCGEKYFCIWG